MRRIANFRIPLLVVALVAGLVTATPAQAYRRRGSYSHSYSAVRSRQQQSLHNAANAQLNAAKQLLAAAEAKGGNAQNKLEAALSKLREEAMKFHDAQSAARQAAKELAEIEQEILDEQKEDSPYAKSAKLVEAARNKLKAVEQRILDEPSIQIELSGLSGAKLAEARERILNVRADRLEARTNLETEAGELSRIRTELFHSDKHWKEAAEALAQARKDEAEAEKMTHAGTSGRQGLNVTAKNAAEAAAVARQAIAQAEAVLKNTGGNRNQNQSLKSKNPPNKK